MPFFLNVMSLFLTVSSSMGRLSSAFVPASRSSCRSFATNSKTPVVHGAGLRRRRPARSGDSGMALIEELQRTKGLYRDFKFGRFVSATDEDIATVETPELAPVFPLEGKDPNEEPPRMRFAPSPTGSLHVGGARTALYNWLVAKKGQLDYKASNAAFVLRVEDTDLARSTRESEEEVLGDLKWLGLEWDEGPDMSQAQAPVGPYRQSERSDLYINAANKLLQEGKAYRCFCTPEEIEEMKAQQKANNETERYDGRWRDADEAQIQKMLNENKPYTVRFKVPEGARVVIDDVVRGNVGWDAQATVGDFIMLRSSRVPVYNFCVAVDDATMGITTVVRAEEHLTNTLRQALILDALGAPRPRYAHCSLILGEDKQKLSKRHGATSCDQYRLDGFLPDAMINYLALLGWNDGTANEIFTRDELIDAFELDRVVKSPSVFDLEKLKWVNSQHMKTYSVEELAPLVKDQLHWEGVFKDDNESPAAEEFTFAATALAKQFMETTKDAALNAKTVLGYGLPATFADVTDAEAKKMIEMGNFYPLATRIVADFEAGNFPLPQQDDDLMVAFKEDSKGCRFTQDYQKHIKALGKEMGIKGKNLFHSIRLALTGEMSGQDVTKQLILLEKACAQDTVIDADKAGVVDLKERMSRLSSFAESIPVEFRQPVKKEEKKKEGKKKGTASSSETKSQESPTVAASVADPKDSYEGPPISALDIRVGRITKVWEHEEADKLFCEEIDVGEEEVRTVASGLKPYLKTEDLEDRLCLVLCNLKARKMAGFPSHGMVLCASNEDHSVVRLVNPPADAVVGERVTIPDFNFEGEEGDPFAENKIGKKKIFEKLAPHLVTNKYGIPEFLGRPFMTSAGACTSPVPDGTVS